MHHPPSRTNQSGRLHKTDDLIGGSLGGMGPKVKSKTPRTGKKDVAGAVGGPGGFDHCTARAMG